MITRKGETGARRRLPGGAEARRADPAVGAGAGQTPRTARSSKGVFNVVTSKRARGQGRTTGSPLVAKFSFTGSTRDRQRADPPVRLDGEEGLDGTGRQRALHRLRRRRSRRRGRHGAMTSKYRNMGQTCVCANRLSCRTACSTPSPKLAAAASALKVGDGLEDTACSGGRWSSGRQGQRSSPTPLAKGRESGDRRPAPRAAAISTSRRC